MSLLYDNHLLIIWRVAANVVYMYNSSDPILLNGMIMWESSIYKNDVLDGYWQACTCTWSTYAFRCTKSNIIFTFCEHTYNHFSIHVPTIVTCNSIMLSQKVQMVELGFGVRHSSLVRNIGNHSKSYTTHHSSRTNSILLHGTCNPVLSYDAQRHVYARCTWRQQQWHHTFLQLATLCKARARDNTYFIDTMSSLTGML
jgi:hypothetical protein